jgi:glutaredoxin 3
MGGFLHRLIGGLSGATARSRSRAAMYQPDKVRLFIKPYCGWCRQAMDWLDGHSIRYELLDVIGNENAYAEMVRLSGQTLAPVIEVDGRILADFGARELAQFWSRLGGPKETA